MNSEAWMEICVLFETRSGLTDPFLGHLEVSLSLNLASNESIRYIADIWLEYDLVKGAKGHKIFQLSLNSN